MPTGPRGEKRPTDAIGCAIMVGQLATGKITEILKEPSGKVRSGKAGSKARAEKLSQEERTAIAKKAAAGRWGRVSLSTTYRIPSFVLSVCSETS